MAKEFSEERQPCSGGIHEIMFVGAASRLKGW